MTIQPVSRKVDGDVVLLPAIRSALLVAGAATLELESGYYLFTEPAPYGTRAIRFVPDEGPVSYASLAAVDPTTLEPTQEALTAWEAVLAALPSIKLGGTPPEAPVDPSLWVGTVVLPEHNLLGATSGGYEYAGATDGEGITLANVYHVGTSVGWRVLGARVWVPSDGAGFPVAGEILAWAASTDSLATPLRTVATTLTPGQWNEVEFDPFTIATNSEFMVGYKTAGPYIAATGVPGGEVAASDGSALRLLSEAAARGRYRYASGANGSTPNFYGVDPVVDEGPAQTQARLFEGGVWRTVT
jgi:hypothetical protein